jgi:zinc transporter ZupT
MVLLGRQAIGDEGLAVVHAVEAGASAHAPAVPSGLTLAGAGLIAAATVAGAWPAFRRPGHQQIWFAAAAGALLIIAGLHLFPDAWAGASAARIWPPLVPIAAIGAFTAAGLAARAGCGCREHSEHASGAGAAAALAIHRFLEGSAVALVGSAAVAIALTAHAFAEGLATGALLGAQQRRMTGWLAVMCVSPIIGAAVAGAFHIPAAAEPVLLALAAGVIAQAAWVSLRAAFHGLRASRLLFSRTAATTTMAAIITALAVHTAG